jgi:hypothetical protein
MRQCLEDQDAALIGAIATTGKGSDRKEMRGVVSKVEATLTRKCLISRLGQSLADRVDKIAVFAFGVGFGFQVAEQLVW